MNAKFRVWAGRLEEMVKPSRHVELRAVLAQMFADLGHPVGEETSKHPNARKRQEFTAQELEGIERRKAEVRAGWSPAEREERKLKTWM